MDSLANKVVLVTGGARGLGLAIVRRFLKAGALVALVDRAAADLDAVKCDLPVHTILGDVRDPNVSVRAVNETVERYGRLDVFVGNAGLYDNRARLTDLSIEQLGPAFDELFDVNVKGYLFGARAALEALKATQGSIIFTASVSGVSAGFGGTLYVASKHAIVGITRQLAWELAPIVRVNAVAPGYVPTGLSGLEALDQGRTTSAPEARRLPLNVIANVDDYAECYVLLASEAGARIATGTVLMADGGLSIAGPGFQGY